MSGGVNFREALNRAPPPALLGLRPGSPEWHAAIAARHEAHRERWLREREAAPSLWARLAAWLS